MTHSLNIPGSCAQGFGACCTILVDDCTSSNFQKNLTYIVNPSYPSTYSSSSATCKYTLSKVSLPYIMDGKSLKMLLVKGTSDICMIRLDFVDGTISEPSGNRPPIKFLVFDESHCFQHILIWYHTHRQPQCAQYLIMIIWTTNKK